MIEFLKVTVKSQGRWGKYAPSSFRYVLPNGYWTTRRLDKSWTRQLADWTACRL